MRKLSKYISLFAILSASFVMVLNTSMTRVASPHFIEVLGVNYSQLTWVYNSYQIVYAILLPVFGLLGDKSGKRRCLMGGLIVFGIGSILSAVAWNYPSLVFFRIIQGLGAAAVSPNAVVIATSLYPPGDRGKVMSIWSMAISMGSVMGPTIGGFIIRFLGWKYIFLINAPFAVLALIPIMLTVKPDSVAAKSFGFDIKGTMLLATMIVTLVSGLQNASALGWGSPTVLGMFFVFAVCLPLFIKVEKQVEEPLIDLRSFSNKTFLAGIYTGGAYLFALQGMQFLMPLYLTQIKGMDTLAMGIFMMPRGLVRLVVSPLAGIWEDKYSVKMPVVVGVIARTLSMLSLAFVTAQASNSFLTVAFLLDGIGAAMMSSPTMSAVLKSSPPEKSASIAGTYEMVRFIAGVVGLVLVGLVMDKRYADNFVPNAPVPGYVESYLVLAAVTALALLFVNQLAAADKAKVKEVQ